MEIQIGNIKSRIVGCDQHIVNSLQKTFRIERSYDEWSKAPSMRWMNLVDSNGYFYTGIIDEVTSYLKNNNYVFDIVDGRDFSNYKNEKHAKYVIETLPYKLRPYQLDALRAAWKYNRGTFYSATGTGKTVIMGGVIALFDVPTIVLVGKKDLAFQLQKELEEIIDEHVGIIGGGKIDASCRVVVGVFQSFVNKAAGKNKKFLYSEIYERTRMVIIDESHHIQASTYQSVLSRFSNAVFRYGFTASPYASKIMRAIMDESGNVVGTTKEKQSSLILQLHTGRNIFTYGISQAVNDGWLSKPIVELVKYTHSVSSESVYGKTFHEVYDRDIVDNVSRNKLIIDEILKELNENDGNVVVFVTRVHHGMTLSDMLIERGIDDSEVSFVNGEMGDSGRIDALKKFKNGTLRVLIGTSILNEGLNFLSTLGINAAAGDSDIGVIQKFGRILRKPRTESGDVDTALERNVRFIDIVDAKHVWFTRHSRSRRNMYDELGVSVTIVG